MTEGTNIRIAGVMGWPVAHSRSPILHGYWLSEHRIAGHYVPFAVRPEDLGQALKALAPLGIAGCNLTIPLKEKALVYLDEIEGRAHLMGAVNTVVVRDGRLAGFNTDVDGFRESLREAVPSFAGRHATILGAGGAARAVLAALVDLGIRDVRLANRNIARAQTLHDALSALALHIEIVPWDERAAALGGTDLLVNATSLGMSGGEALVLDLANLPAHAIVADLVYVPLETPLLAAARARGNHVVDGLGMLLHQARFGFAQWFGVMPDVTPALRARVQASLGI